MNSRTDLAQPQNLLPKKLPPGHDPARQFWGSRILQEARTRILLLYLLLMLLITAAAVPLFRWLLFANIDNRVRADLSEEMTDFRQAFLAWEESPEQDTSDLKRFIFNFFAKELPEDDNFFIAVVEGKIYQSSPAILPDPFRPDSDLISRWSGLTEPTTGEKAVADPDIESILYLVQPLMVDGRLKGVFVTAHTTAGERNESLVGVYIFAQVASAVVLLSFILAWLSTGQVLAPLRKLTTTAQAIVSESDLSQRIPKISGGGELAELAEVFNKMMDRIQASFDSQRNFINDAGHELRTPITIIQGHLELMGDDPEEQRETMNLIVDELDRMNRFVNDLILLAKSERTDFLQLELMDVATFMDDIYGKVSGLMTRKWHVVNRASDRMTGDRQRLIGAMLNLINNAVQHTQSDDLIEVGVVTNPTEVRFWVRDTGEGISLEDQQRIFDRFARAANSYRRSEGVGLGLAIVKAIVTAHHGQIELSSQLGMGSTFTLVLPTEPLQARQKEEKGKRLGAAGMMERRENRGSDRELGRMDG